jgi:quinoprotein glucose dehydrogenase
MPRPHLPYAAALIAIAAALSHSARDAAPALLAGAASEWPAADGVRGAHSSPLDDITPANVGALQVAWTYHTGETSAGGGARGGTAFEATPIMVGGTLYLSTPTSRVVALDAETGRERWTFDPRIDRSPPAQGMTTSRGVSTWIDPERGQADACRRRIFVASADARLFALDALSGEPCADFGEGGELDLGSGVERIAGRRGDYKESAPPAVAGDLVVVGSSILDSRYADAPSGVVRAFDARSGALRWSWEPLPGVGGRLDDGTYVPAGAANTWATMTVDPERDLVFVPTGSASPDHWGGLRPGDNLYANSLVALRASTGEMQWHFQMVHHDLWDYDLASPPALITVTREGRSVPAVAQGTKMGYVFILDRETGEPLFPVEERPAPASDVSRAASPTQPVPVFRPPCPSVGPKTPGGSRLTALRAATGPRGPLRRHVHRPAGAAASCIRVSSAASPGAEWPSIPGPGCSSPIRTTSRWWRRSFPRRGSRARRWTRGERSSPRGRRRRPTPSGARSSSRP